MVVTMFLPQMTSLALVVVMALLTALQLDLAIALALVIVLALLTGMALSLTVVLSLPWAC